MSVFAEAGLLYVITLSFIILATSWGLLAALFLDTHNGKSFLLFRFIPGLIGILGLLILGSLIF